jgi:glycosyltransferase involved in cell wall biosynthesis
MRILVLSNLYPPAALGGYERMCRDVVERFRRRGHAVAVLTSTLGAPVEDRDPSVQRRLALSWDGREIACPSLVRQIALERVGRRALTHTLAGFRPDVVSVWGMGALSLGLLSSLAAAGPPIVYVVGDDWLVYGRWADCWTRRLDGGSKRASILARMLRLPGAPGAIGRTGTFCFVSEFTRRRAEEFGQVELARAQVIPAGIDPGDFPAAPPDERPWRRQILCVGRLEPAKGFDTAIRALPRLPPDATLTIVGDGRHRDELARIARETGVEDRVVWKTCDRSEMAANYRAADALVFPSTGHEAFGLVPLEAMACGTPVVATGAGGSAEFLADGENSLLFPPSDPEALADTLRRLAADGDLRRRVVAGGLATAARLTVDRQADELEAVHLVAARR